MKKMKFDKADYPEGEAHCILLPILMKQNVKFVVSSAPDNILVSVKKPEIARLMYEGNFLYADPNEIQPGVFRVVAVKHASSYNPWVRKMSDFRMVKNREILPSYVKIDSEDY